MTPGSPPLLTNPDVRGRHLLVLPGDVGPAEVEVLAVSRFPRAVWEVDPGARSGRAAARTGLLRLSRHSTLHGPFVLDDDSRHTLRLPATAGLAYALHDTVDRGDAPWPGGGDRDGLGRAFPRGLPVRDADRSVTWLVAAARRLGGAVRIAAREPSDPGTLLVPDPAAAVDLTVWSDIWLDPDAALTVLRRVAPSARLNLPDGTWTGPANRPRVVPGTEPLDEEVKAVLHAIAEERDAVTMAEPPPMTGYGALVGMELDGLVALEIGGETELPPVLQRVAWAARGAITYRVRWEPWEIGALEDERPPTAHRIARARATRVVVAIARAVHAEVGGEITDAMDFVVDPQDL